MTDDTRPTLQELSHTNPFTNTAFGEAMVFHRGPVVAADGGEDREKAANDDSATASTDRRGARLADIDHTPPYGESVNRVYERGTEGRNKSA